MNTSAKRKVVYLLVLVLSFSAHAAKPEWASNKHEKHKPEDRHVEPVKAGQSDDLSQLFSSQEIKLIRDYYDTDKSKITKDKSKAKNLPYGLQKKLERGGELPPGWQKKLQRGEVLDPVLRAQSRELPPDLLSRLPINKTATDIIRLQDKVIRVAKGQGTIIDIIDIADILVGGQ